MAVPRLERCEYAMPSPDSGQLSDLRLLLGLTHPMIPLRAFDPPDEYSATPNLQRDRLRRERETSSVAELARFWAATRLPEMDDVVSAERKRTCNRMDQIPL